MGGLENLVADVNRALRARGWSARQASLEATDNAELIRDMRRGRVPSVESLQALCRVLELEFYVGTRRDPGAVDERRLEDALDAVERTLATHAIGLAPRDKARAVAALYALLDREREPVTAERVERLIGGLTGEATRREGARGP